LPTDDGRRRTTAIYLHYAAPFPHMTSAPLRNHAWLVAESAQMRRYRPSTPRTPVAARWFVWSC